jgi:hypothetical protein
MAPREYWEKWIPGSHLAVRPGMTAWREPGASIVIASVSEAIQS